jgi:hypothetical protein
MVDNPNILQWGNTKEFATYLSRIEAPHWFKKIALHHTVIPTIDQWRGKASMVGMLGYYKGLGWSSFPHLYSAPDGIWQMNNVLLLGTHTNAANAFSISIEVVGNYDKDVWKDPIYTQTVAMIMELIKWGGLTTRDIIFHRDYNPSKTCPGKAITVDWVQHALQTVIPPVLPSVTNYRVIVPKANVRELATTKSKVVAILTANDVVQSAYTTHGEALDGEDTWMHIDRASHLSQVNNITGFMHKSLLEVVG